MLQEAITHHDESAALLAERPRTGPQLPSWLELMALGAVVVQAWAFWKLCATDEGYGTNMLIAVVSTVLNVWALRDRLHGKG